MVFDEAHNIDNVCIEVMSINFRLATLERCQQNLSWINGELLSMKRNDEKRLRGEYEKLVSDLAARAGAGTGINDELAANPVLPDEVLQQAVPGNIRRADTFVKYLQKLVHHLKGRMAGLREVTADLPAA